MSEQPEGLFAMSPPHGEAVPGPSEAGPPAAGGAIPKVDDGSEAARAVAPVAAATEDSDSDSDSGPDSGAEDSDGYESEGMGLRSPEFRPEPLNLQHLRRGSAASSRRSSISSVGSGGTDRSHRRRPRRPQSPAFAPVDAYLFNPDYPRWDEEEEEGGGKKGKEKEEVDAGLGYTPWTQETEQSVVDALSEISDPPHQGMLERVDPTKILRSCTDDSDADIRVRSAWAKLLIYYDSAMTGKREALLALRGAHTRIMGDYRRLLWFADRVDTVEVEVEQLTGQVDRLEGENARQQQRLAYLERENETLTKDRAVRLGLLERIVADWESLSGLKFSHSTTARGDGDDTRFRRIRDALEEAGAEAARTQARYDYLQEQYDGLEKAFREAVGSAGLSPGNGSPMSEWECKSKIMRSEQQNRVLESELRTEQARAARMEGQHTEEIARLTGQSEFLFQQQQTEIDRLKNEAAVYKEAWLSIQATIDELKQGLSDWATAATYGVAEHNTPLEEVAECIRDLDAMVAGVLDALEGASSLAAAGPQSSSIQEPLQTEKAIRDREVAQLETLNSSGAIIDGIKARISEIEEQVSGGVAGPVPASTPWWLGNLLRRGWQLISTVTGRGRQEAEDLVNDHGIPDKVSASPAMGHAEAVPTSPADGNHESMASKTERCISEALEKINIAIDCLSEQFEQVKQEGSEINGYLDVLHQQLQSQEDNFQDMTATVRRQHEQIEAARVVPQSWRAGLASTELSPEHIGGDFRTDLSGADDVETEALRAAIALIEQLRTDLGEGGAEDAVLQRIKQLGLMIEEVKSSDPDTIAEMLMAALKQFLEYSVAHGIKDDTVAFRSTLDRHDEKIRAYLAEVEHFNSPQAEEDRTLLESIRQKMQDLVALVGGETRLMDEYEAHRLRNTQRPLHSEQSEELCRLASSFVERRKRPRGPALEKLVSQIQEVVADPYLGELRAQLMDGITQYEAQRSELGDELSRALQRADGLQTQIDAFTRMESQRSRENRNQASIDEFDQKFERHLEIRARRLRRELRWDLARISWFDDQRETAGRFLKEGANEERRRAEKLLTETLVKLQRSSRAGNHGEGTCFCTLLRVLFPRIYYSTVSGGCCAGGKQAGPTSASTSATARGRRAPTCQGHHGHGALPASGRLWTLVCRVLTSLAWLVLLILIQPYNLTRTAAFLLSFLLGLPLYLFRLVSSALSHAHRRMRHQRRHARPRHPSSPPAPQQPLPQPQSPPHPAQPQHHQQPPPSPEPELQLPSPVLLLPQATPPPASAVVGSAVTLLLVFTWLSYVAVLVERRIWLGGNEWRFAYVVDVATRAPYAAWSPVRVDYRLVWVWCEEAVHGLFFSAGGEGARRAGKGGGEVR